MKIDNIYNTVLSLVFIFIIVVVMLMFFITKKETIDKLENRQLAPFPEFSMNELDPFPSQFDSYYTDHFPLRSRVIKIFSKLNINILKDSPLPDKVIIGNNDYLFIAGNHMETCQGKNLFSDEELASILNELVFRRDFCSKVGAKFYFVIIPQKHTIYRENIPQRFKLLSRNTMRTQLEAYLEDNLFQVIDPTNYIIKKKSDSIPLYFKTDNHWNIQGAFYGTQLIVDKIKEDFPQLKSLNLSEYTVSETEGRAGNLAQMLNMQDELHENNVILDPNFVITAKKGTKVPYTPVSGFGEPDKFEIVYVNPKANNLRALIIRESFAGNQEAFYKETFGKTVLIWDRWQYKLNEDIITNENPDIVIIQILESELRKLLQYQSKDSSFKQTNANS